MLSLSEFGKEEYQAANVDPIAQFSKPVAVLPTCLLFIIVLSLLLQFLSSN